MRRKRAEKKEGRYGRTRRGRSRWLLAVLLLLALAALPVLLEAPELLRRLSYPLPPEHAGTMREAATEQGIEPALVAAVIRTESRFREGAESSQGAYGLMQVRPQTAAFIQERSGIAGDYREPKTNVRMGTWYLGYLLGRYDGDVALTLAAYNSGEGRVDEWLSGGGTDVRSNFPFPETREYVGDVLEARDAYAELYGRDLDRDG